MAQSTKNQEEDRSLMMDESSRKGNAFDMGRDDRRRPSGLRPTLRENKISWFTQELS
jgi:hypothetical protein